MPPPLEPPLELPAPPSATPPLLLLLVPLLLLFPLPLLELLLPAPLLLLLVPLLLPFPLPLLELLLPAPLLLLVPLLPWVPLLLAPLLPWVPLLLAPLLPLVPLLLLDPPEPPSCVAVTCPFVELPQPGTTMPTLIANSHDTHRRRIDSRLLCCRSMAFSLQLRLWPKFRSHSSSSPGECLAPRFAARLASGPLPVNI
jgi:hypothetical protein